MKKMLMVSTVPSMIGQFNMNNISMLLELGYEVHVACDWNDRSVWTIEKINALKKQLNNLGVKYHQIDYSRSMFRITKHLKSYKQTLDLVTKNQYDFIHCHTPIASVIARLVCKKTNTKCVYTAHGFHFYKGAPIQNWIIFYPIEKWLSKYTDILITINKEDYKRAKDNFYMNRLEYIPGVGIDIDYIKSITIDKAQLKQNLKIPKDNVVIISVGELSKRKNHEIVIKALKNKKNVTYVICGQGNLEEYLNNLAKEYNVDLKLLGFRNDRLELIKMSDIFAFPSLQEGLPVALMEALAIGIPCVASKIRGNVDLIKEGKNGELFNLDSVQSLQLKFEKVFNILNKYNCISDMEKYSISNIYQQMMKIYKSEILQK